MYTSGMCSVTRWYKMVRWAFSRSVGCKALFLLVNPWHRCWLKPLKRISFELHTSISLGPKAMTTSKSVQIFWKLSLRRLGVPSISSLDRGWNVMEHWKIRGLLELDLKPLQTRVSTQTWCIKLSNLDQALSCLFCFFHSHILATPKCRCCPTDWDFLQRRMRTGNNMTKGNQQHLIDLIDWIHGLNAQNLDENRATSSHSPWVRSTFIIADQIHSFDELIHICLANQIASVDQIHLISLVWVGQWTGFLIKSTFFWWSKSKCGWSLRIYYIYIYYIYI